MRSILSIIAFSLLASGCYNKDFNEPGRIRISPRDTERVLEMQFSRVWAATQQVMSRFPIDQRNEDGSSRRAYIVTDWIEGHSDTLYSGYGDVRIPYRIRYKLYVYVQGEGGATQIRVDNVEQYRDDVITAGVDFEGSVETWIRVDSSTLKEAKLLDEIEKLVRDRSFQPNNDIR